MVKSTPVFTTLSPSQIIQVGTDSIQLSGRVALQGGVNPTGNVYVSINGIQTPAIPLSDGGFVVNYNTLSIPASSTPYPITYTYDGDTNYLGIVDSSTSLTVVSVITTPVFSGLVRQPAIEYGTPVWLCQAISPRRRLRGPL